MRTYPLLPNSRRTIYVDQEPGLDATDVSARIDADQPIFAERAMYMTSGGQPFTGGTASAGIAAPAHAVVHRRGRDRRVLRSLHPDRQSVGQPRPRSPSPTCCRTARPSRRPHHGAAESRLTIAVKDEDPRLAATAVSATITSTNGTPIVVERAMWWPSPTWYEGTVTAATTTQRSRWALAGGFIDPPARHRNVPADRQSRLDRRERHDRRRRRRRRRPIRSSPTGSACRVTVPGSGARPLHDRSQGACARPLGADVSFPMRVAGTITSDGPPIVVERSTYWSAGDQFWAAGASTLLTPLP